MKRMDFIKRNYPVSKSRFELKRDELKKKRLQQQYSKNPSIYESILLEKVPNSQQKRGQKKKSPFRGKKFLPKKRELFLSSKQIEEESKRLRNEIEMLDGEIEKYEKKEISSPLNIFSTPKNKKQLSTMKNLFMLTLDKLDSSYTQRRREKNILDGSEMDGKRLFRKSFRSMEDEEEEDINEKNDDTLKLEDNTFEEVDRGRKRNVVRRLKGLEDDEEEDFEAYKARQKRKMKLLYKNDDILISKKKRKNMYNDDGVKGSGSFSLLDRKRGFGVSKDDVLSSSLSEKQNSKDMRNLQKENEFLKEELGKKNQTIETLQMDLKLLRNNYEFLKQQMKRIRGEDGGIERPKEVKRDVEDNKGSFKRELVGDIDEEIDVDVNVHNNSLMVTVENNTVSLDNYMKNLELDEKQ